MAINAPMTAAAVVAYLGIMLAGCVAVSIADSFVAGEIATRLRISGARAIITQARARLPSLLAIPVPYALPATLQ